MTLNQIVNEIEPNMRTSAKKILVEIRFIEKTLRRLREEIDASPVTEEFSQGKQNFKREQPALKSYSTLVARYSTLHRQLVGMLPKGAEIEDDELDRWISTYENDVSE